METKIAGHAWMATVNWSGDETHLKVIGPESASPEDRAHLAHELTWTTRASLHWSARCSCEQWWVNDKLQEGTVIRDWDLHIERSNLHRWRGRNLEGEIVYSGLAWFDPQEFPSGPLGAPSAIRLSPLALGGITAIEYHQRKRGIWEIA